MPRHCEYLAALITQITASYPGSIWVDCARGEDWLVFCPPNKYHGMKMDIEYCPFYDRIPHPPASICAIFQKCSMRNLERYEGKHLQYGNTCTWRPACPRSTRVSGAFGCAWGALTIPQMVHRAARSLYAKLHWSLSTLLCPPPTNSPPSTSAVIVHCLWCHCIAKVISTLLHYSHCGMQCAQN